MSDARVILVTVAGPGGHVDIGVRSDATPAELAVHLSGVLGLASATPTAEHRSPPRPGGPPARWSVMRTGVPLSEAGVVDGDVLIFTEADQSAVPAAWERGTRQP